MPRIPDVVLKCSVYLYPTVHDAMSGVRVGGSGFVVGYPFSADPERHHFYIVSNVHVVKKAPIVRLNTNKGEKDVLPLRVSDWLPHPDGDDIAVAAVEIPIEADLSFQATDGFISEETAASLPIGPGDEVFMVGRFINHEGEQRNLPTARFGNVAMMPYEKIRHESGLLVEAFLVEMRSLSGYSGSPVFYPVRPVERFPLPIPPGSQVIPVWGPVLLLGIDFGHSYIRESIRNDSDEKEESMRGLYVRSNTGIAHVAPAWRLLDVLNRSEFAERRAATEERVKDKPA